MADIKLNFKKEGTVKRVSFIIKPTTLGLTLPIIIFLILAGVVLSNLGFTLLTLIIICSFLLALIVFILPKKKILIYDLKNEVFTMLAYGFLAFLYARLSKTDIKRMEERGKRIPPVQWFFKTITPEQSIQISNYFGINPNLELPYYEPAVLA